MERYPFQEADELGLTVWTCSLLNGQPLFNLCHPRSNTPQYSTDDIEQVGDVGGAY